MKKSKRIGRKKLLQSRPTQGIKISEAILILSDSLRKKYRTIQQTKDIVSITIMAWNISLYPDAEQENVQRMLVDTLPENLAGEDIGVLLTTIDELVEQKQKIYPNVREYILNHSLSFMGKNMTLVTATAPISGEIKRKVMA